MVYGLIETEKLVMNKKQKFLLCKNLLKMGAMLIVTKKV